MSANAVMDSRWRCGRLAGAERDAQEFRTGTRILSRWLFDCLHGFHSKSLVSGKMLSRVGCLSVLLAMVCAEQKVPVSVYYESLCPDSIAFITKQLVPTYNTGLKDRMDLKLVPYGKASHQKSPDGQRWEFKCHHGPVECYGNKVQSCILDQIRNNDDQIKYIDCLMNQAKTTKNEYPLGPCLSAGDLAIITSCANSTHASPNGSDLLAANGDITASLNPPLTSVPTVIFNKTFNKTEQQLAQTDFKKLLCSYLKNDCPIDCKSSATTFSLSLILPLFSALALTLPETSSRP